MCQLRIIQDEQKKSKHFFKKTLILPKVRTKKDAGEKPAAQRIDKTDALPSKVSKQTFDGNINFL